jgi:hypothetical protein
MRGIGGSSCLPISQTACQVLSENHGGVRVLTLFNLPS